MRKFPSSRKEYHLWLNPRRLHSPHQTKSKYFALTCPDSQMCIRWKRATLFPMIFVQGITEMQYCALSGKVLRRSGRGLGLCFSRAVHRVPEHGRGWHCFTHGPGTRIFPWSRERNEKEASFSGTPLWWQTLSSIAKDIQSAFIGKQPPNTNLF